VYKATVTFILKQFPHFNDKGVQTLELKCPSTSFIVNDVNVDNCKKIDEDKNKTNESARTNIQKYNLTFLYRSR